MQYIVARNDSLSKIAFKHNCRETDLCNWNKLPLGSPIIEGQTICLSAYKPATNYPRRTSHFVQFGDSLQSIAHTYLGSTSKWRSIAQLNHLPSEDQIFIGQELLLPNEAKLTSINKPVQTKQTHNQAKHIPLRSFFFILADEIVPNSGKAVRKVIFPEAIQGNPELIRQVLRPDKYGFHPIEPLSSVSIGRHVLGMTNSRFISASMHKFGSPRFSGKPYWINTKRLHSTGTKIHDAEAISKDLDRIAQKAKDPKFKQYIEDIRYKSLHLDKEILIEGSIPPSAIKGGMAKGLTHGLQFISLVGIVLSTHDLYLATNQSIAKNSVKPIAAEVVKQAGGWGGAYAGMQLGATLGALVGIETGPGAVLTAAAGSIIFGVSGYLGADWISDYITDNP